MSTVEQLRGEFERFKKSHRLASSFTPYGKIEYLACGSGKETILFFHGLAGNAYSGYRFVLALENDYRIIAPTVPALANATVNRALEMVDCILSHENLTPAIVIGGSFGGMLAQAFWYKSKLSVKKIIVFDSAPPNKSLGLKNQRASRLFNLLPWLITRPLFKMQLERLFKLEANQSKDAQVLLTFGRIQFEEIFKDISKSLLIAHGKIAFDFMTNYPAPNLTDWEGKMLIIYSEDDPSIKQVSSLFREIYSFPKMVGFRGAGHLGSLLLFDEYIKEMNYILKP